MEQLFKMSLHTHMFSIVLLILSQIAFFWIKKEPDFIAFVKKAKNLYLIQIVLYGIVVFTGLLLLSVLKFEVWNLAIVAMIVVAVAVLVHQILLFKKMRPIRSDEFELQRDYKEWASKVFGAEVGAESVVFVLVLLVG